MITAQYELAKARTAWTKYQSTRDRDAVYGYLTAVFEVVSLWKQRRRVKTSFHRALIATKRRGTSRVQEPFAGRSRAKGDYAAGQYKARGGRERIRTRQNFQ